MVTAAELLTGAINVDRTLIVDNAFRTIKIPSSVRNLGVENDDEVLYLDFKLPRYVSDTDLSKFVIRINYINAQGETDAYTVLNPTVSDQYIIFKWLVGPTATRYKGDTSFIICAVKLKAGSDEVDKEFNTTRATLPVLEGLEVDESIVTEYSDLIAQWQKEIYGALANQEDVHTKADAIVCEAESEVIAVDDASNDSVRGLKLFGKTEQRITTGKNLLECSVDVGSHVINGITFNVRDDGSIVCSGTTSVATALILTQHQITEDVIVSGCPSGGDTKKYRITVDAYKDGVFARSYFDIGSGVTITTANADYINVNIHIYQGITVNGLVFYPMIRRASVANAIYEPYTGGIASPNPYYPQKLTSSGDDGNIGVTLSGKNLWDEETVSGYWQSSSGNFVSSSEQLASKNLIQIPSKIYVVTPSYAMDFIFYDRNKVFISSKTIWDQIDSVESPAGACYMHINLKDTYGTEYKNDVCISAVPTEYEQYKPAQTIITSTPAGLRSLPDLSSRIDTTYTDENGNNYVADEVDYKKKKRIERIYYKELNGTENIKYYFDRTNCFSIETGLIIDTGKCSHYQNIHSLTGSDGVYLHYTSALLFVDSRFDGNIDGFKAWLAGEYADGHPVTVIAIHTVPIEYNLSEEEIAAFKALHTNCPNTTVLNDAGATMKLIYNADTKTWVKNLPGASDEQIESAVNKYLEENPIDVTVDTTLSKSGQAADAKAVGDKIGSIETALDGIIAIQESLIGGDAV